MLSWIIKWRMMKSGYTVGHHNEGKHWLVESIQTKKCCKNFKKYCQWERLQLPFLDYDGILLIAYSPQGLTIMTASYFDILVCLQQAIKWKWCGKLSQKILLMHDNVQPHTAALIKALLTNLKWEVFSHPSYLLDLASLDVHLFLGSKRSLGWRHFSTDAELHEGSTFFKKQHVKWYRAAVQ